MLLNLSAAPRSVQDPLRGVNKVVGEEDMDGCLAKGYGVALVMRRSGVQIS